jgi:hypothetical protein
MSETVLVYHACGHPWYAFIHYTVGQGYRNGLIREQQKKAKEQVCPVCKKSSYTFGNPLSVQREVLSTAGWYYE